jgi:hypothetical protein
MDTGSLCGKASGARSRLSATVVLVPRPGRKPKDPGLMHPGPFGSWILNRMLTGMLYSASISAWSAESCCSAAALAARSMAR